MNNLENLKNWINSKLESHLEYEERTNEALILGEFLDDLGDELIQLEGFTRGEDGKFITKLRDLLQ